ncbi:MAG TPA: PEP-CTERM sorting domain-containing protein [Candidatus Acidoferrales bacterium]|nr:PEP-CTERM sorting domain-containing protein [Candidatus Acidoferrales bacterium]
MLRKRAVQSISAMVVLGFLSLWPGRAKAQTLLDPANDRLCAPLTVCNGTSSGSIIVTSTVPALAFSNTGADESGTAWLVILVPSATDQHLSFTVTTGNGTSAAADKGLFTSGDLLGAGGLLGVAVATNVGPTGGFSPLSSASGLSGAGTPTQFNVYLVSLGAYSSTTNQPLNIIINTSSFPVGTVFWGYLTSNEAGTAVDSVPYSEAVVAGTVVPEPGTLGLVGTGLLALGIALRRRLGVG